MSGASTKTADWSTRLTPAPHPDSADRPNDSRLGDSIRLWQGDLDDFQPGRPILVGFPQDEGVRRNRGRIGAARAPDEIRRFLYRLTPGAETELDIAGLHPLDLGNLVVDADLEGSQVLLAQVVAAILGRGAVPIVLGGGHETAFGHFLGYAEAAIPVGIINIDAHLDVRPLIDGQGHSGSPFRQAMEHAGKPLPGTQYACLGAQPFSTAAEHLRFVRDRGGEVVWREALTGTFPELLRQTSQRYAARGCRVYLTIDSDAVCAADVPGVSAPNPLGLSGAEVAWAAFQAGAAAETASMDLVEINPLFDVDGRSARWGALVVWHFLGGLAQRPR